MKNKLKIMKNKLKIMKNKLKIMKIKQTQDYEEKHTKDYEEQTQNYLWMCAAVQDGVISTIPDVVALYLNWFICAGWSD